MRWSLNPLLSTLLISIPTLSRILIAISSYSFILILKVGEYLDIPPLAPKTLDITLGRFFIRSSGEINEYWKSHLKENENL
jgi:hypothetical protein